jgi:hypothetical protein
MNCTLAYFHFTYRQMTDRYDARYRNTKHIFVRDLDENRRLKKIFYTNQQLSNR